MSAIHSRSRKTQRSNVRRPLAICLTVVAACLLSGEAFAALAFGITDVAAPEAADWSHRRATNGVLTLGEGEVALPTQILLETLERGLDARGAIAGSTHPGTDTTERPALLASTVSSPERRSVDLESHFASRGRGPGQEGGENLPEQATMMLLCLGLAGSFLLTRRSP